MRILIAEDDPVSRIVLAKILATEPAYRVTLAEDGAAAWALLDDPGRSFDVAFVDIDMPKMDGFELLRRIHEAPLLKTLHVVMCTAANDRPTVVKAAQFGARHYLVKPCTQASVLSKLRQLSSPELPGSERNLGGL